VTRAVQGEASVGIYCAVNLARIYAMVGELDSALDQLAYLLSVPGPLTAAWVRIDPTWAALRDNSRFQRMLTHAE
jgi:hypothetical protein